MKTLLRATLIAAAIALPVAAFAQSNGPVQVDESQVQIVAYEVVDAEPVVALVPMDAPRHSSGAQSVMTTGTSSFHPAIDVGLQSIYVRH